MDAQFAKVRIQGIVASGPELRYQTSGVPVTSMTVSVKREAKTPSGWTTDFLDVVVIGDDDHEHAENAACFEQGQLVCIEGHLVTQRWDSWQGRQRVQKQRMAVKAVSIEHCECVPHGN